MRVDRWFNVLVLGGAALAGACKSGDGEDVGMHEAGDGGTSATSGGSAGDGASAAGLSSSAGTGGAAGTGGTAEAGMSPFGGGGGAVGVDGGSGGNSGTAPIGAGASSGGVGGSAGSSSESGAGGGAGSAAQLACHIDASGHGLPGDPCGCPCCWARDCPNTDTACCGGFCQGADERRGCCGK